MNSGVAAAPTASLAAWAAVFAALVTGIIAAVNIVFSFMSSRKMAAYNASLDKLKREEERKYERQKITDRYREPLIHAAYDLQSRLYNILERDLIGQHLVHGAPREQMYVVDNTTFLIGQYFAWAEIIRRELQYIDLGQHEETKELAKLRDEIYSLWQTDRYSPLLRVFAGEQRAIGECLIVEGTPSAACIGYAAFLRLLADQREKNKGLGAQGELWRLEAEGHAHQPRVSAEPEALFTGRPDQFLEFIRYDVCELGHRLSEARPRLVAIQNALIDLLLFLDRDFIRFPASRRTKIVA